MKDLVIELFLISMIVVPVIADSLQPVVAIRHNRSCVLRRLRRSA